MRMLISCTLALLAVALPAAAQEKYPSKPVTILIGYPPGGSIDTTSRAFAPVLEKYLGQPVLIQTKPGAAAMIGTQAAAHAAPDGYTITVATTQLSLLPAVDKVFDRPPTFTRDMFRPIARLAAEPSTIFVNASRPWKTFKELVEDAKQHPSQIVFASGGLYGTTHLPIAMIEKAAGIKLRHLPTAGGGPALTAVLGNNAALLAAHPAVGGPQVKAGKLRPLVSMSAERSTAFPDVPTLKEVGYPGVEYYQWSGVFVPAKTPEAVVKVLSEAVAKAAKDPAFIGAMEKLGASVDYQDAAAFAPWWDADSRKTEETVQAIGKVQ
jgi:tripartite-type tricarboxylate transporter receptor subunit TctC